MLGVPRLGVDEDAVPVGFALEIVLGQGRALIGSMRLLTEQSDPPVETFLAQGLCCKGAGHAAADNDEAGFGVHRCGRPTSWAAIPGDVPVGDRVAFLPWGAGAPPLPGAGVPGVPPPGPDRLHG